MFSRTDVGFQHQVALVKAGLVVLVRARKFPDIRLSYIISFVYLLFGTYSASMGKRSFRSEFHPDGPGALKNVGRVLKKWGCV